MSMDPGIDSREARQERQERKSMELCVFLFLTVPSQIFFRPKHPGTVTEPKNLTFPSPQFPNSSFLIPNSRPWALPPLSPPLLALFILYLPGF